MSILHDLYDGNICPMEKFAKKNGKYDRLMAEMTDNIKRLMSTLDETEQQLWNDILEAELQMGQIAQKESFVDGFRFGARIMLEIMSYDHTDRTEL